MDSPKNIVSKTDHDQSPGYQIVHLVGGASAGQMASVHIEQADHTTPQGEVYRRLDPHRFVAESMLAGMFGGRR